MWNRPKPLVLLMLDGFGHALGNARNAIAAAKPPYLGKLQQDYPMTLMNGSGSVSDSAPTLLDILALPQLSEMTGRALLAAD